MALEASFITAVETFTALLKAITTKKRIKVNAVII